MSDLFEKKLFLSPAARRRGGKAGFALGRILSVIFFVIALGMFFGGKTAIGNYIRAFKKNMIDSNSVRIVR